MSDPGVEVTEARKRARHRVGVLPRQRGVDVDRIAGEQRAVGLVEQARRAGGMARRVDHDERPAAEVDAVAVGE
jgi:hypothetical protein